MPAPVCLVCEDEALIALDLEATLSTSGFAIAGPFATSAEAFLFIQTNKPPDIALLNFSLGDGGCTPLIHALRQRGVPIVVQSGLLPDTSDMPSEVVNLPWLTKPVSEDMLLDAMEQALPSFPRSNRKRRSAGLSEGETCSALPTQGKGKNLSHVLTNRLAALSALGEADRHALDGIVVRTFKVDGGNDITRAEQQNAHCHVLLNGMAASYKLLADGRRQITRFCLPGDILDLDGLVGGKLDHNVLAIGTCNVGAVPHGSLRNLSHKPDIALALWRHTLADTAASREWVVNVGRRSSAERIAHLICELVTRLSQAGLVIDISGKRTCYVPFTQVHIADATGLSTVHVNRSLQELRSRGLIELSRDKLTVLNWENLNAFASFEPGYLFPVLHESYDDTDVFN
ncbi:helix-turn-helix domain-containing protein [Tianweitania sp. BSSL-BM11]|uniref:Helix-turn-helix domain-containing protein n=1 Tax=Tianweitania aestuarii TaxID=2814886 RepID=A0ABS5RWU4_9HYPH|nr:helix-turn-helix domain-containing protein [Tianweitania aestuarii]MBS9721496.1 helix-turn-helix domain-containing protein [Tianweitania aestuarii]